MSLEEPPAGPVSATAAPPQASPLDHRVVVRHFLIGLAPVSGVATASAPGSASEVATAEGPDSHSAIESGDGTGAASVEPPAAATAASTALPCAIGDLWAPLRAWLTGVGTWAPTTTAATPPTLDVTAAYVGREALLRWIAATGSKPELAELQMQRWRARQAVAAAASTALPLQRGGGGAGVKGTTSPAVKGRPPPAASAAMGSEPPAASAASAIAESSGAPA